MRGLNGRRVVVTGAAQGIGRATARRFFEEGCALLLVDMAPLAKTELAAEIGAVDAADDGPRGRVTYLSADVTKAADLHRIEALVEKVGVDVLVNNAGITRDASALKMTDDQWGAVLDVNLTAVFRVCQIAARPMKAQRRGVILNAASVVAHNGNFGQANYVATKAGVVGLTKTLARELGRSGVRVNAVAPGFVDTPMARAVPEQSLAAMVERTPLSRLGTPEEIAAVYAFLASDDASFITGAVVNVDGGLVL